MPPIPRAHLREILADCDLFFGLDASDLDEIVSAGVTRRVDRGEAIFVAGQQGTQLYAVVSGRIRIVATAGDGREMVLRLVDSGEIFGELALLDGGPRTGTAISTQASELLVLDRRDFLGILRRKPGIAIELLAVVAGRLRSTTEQVTDTNFLEIGPRLAKKLLELAESYPEESDEGRVVRVAQDELGAMVAATRVSVNMQLKAWERQGWVRTARGRVVLLDREALAAVGRKA